MSRVSDLNAELRLLEMKANDEYRLKKVHTEKEWEYLCKVIECCDELENLNRGYPNEREKWRRKKDYYDEKAMEIRNILDASKPKPASKPERNAKPVYENMPNQEYENNSESKPRKKSEIPEKFAVYAEKYGSPIPDEDYVSPNSSKDVPPEMIRSWYQDYPNHDLSDVVGMESVKEQAKKEILNKIGWDKMEQEFGMSMLKSYMFYGPYGTGKTFFVEGLAMELMKRGFKFLRLAGSDLHGKYVGVGEKAAKAAFMEAMECAPSILFFDEFDNVCADRDGQSVEGHEKRLSNEFIQEYDKLKAKLEGTTKPVVILTATNYPDKIDGAMRNRISSYLLIPLPPEDLRQLYFKNKLKKFTLSDDVSYEFMADVTDNFGMRDLEKVVNYLKNEIIESAKEEFGVKEDNGVISPELSEDIVLEAISSGRKKLTRELFENALDANKPDKKEDILASLKAFETKL